MNREIRLFMILVLAGALGVASPSYARGFKKGSGDESGMMMQKMKEKGEGFKDKGEKYKEKMKQKLGLTDEQQQQLKEHRKAHWAEAKKYSHSVKDLKSQMQAELEKAEFDQAKVEAINDQLKLLKNKIADHRLQGVLEVRQILTAEQFKKFKEFKEKGEGKWDKMHKKGRKDFDGYRKGEGRKAPQTSPEGIE